MIKIKKIITYCYTFFYLAKKLGFICFLNYFFQNNLSRKKEIKIKPKGFKDYIFFRRGDSDFTVFSQVFFSLEYEFPLNFIPKNIIDCGANVGFASLYFSMKYPSSNIIAIEPEINNLEQIKKNVSNEFNINILHGGVWHSNSRLQIVQELKSDSWSYTCKEATNDFLNSFPAFAIESIMKDYAIDEIDILKVDIEGSEIELFSKKYEYWLPRTKAIFIELHDWNRKGCSKMFFSTLLNYDFSVFIKGENLICIKN